MLSFQTSSSGQRKDDPLSMKTLEEMVESFTARVTSINNKALDMGIPQEEVIDILMSTSIYYYEITPLSKMIQHEVPCGWVFTSEKLENLVRILDATGNSRTELITYYPQNYIDGLPLEIVNAIISEETFVTSTLVQWITDNTIVL